MRLVVFIKPYLLKIFKSLLLGLVVSILGMLTPYLLKLLIDKVYPTHNISMMETIIGGTIAISMASLFVSTLQEYYNIYINSKINNTTSMMFFNHILHLKVRFYDTHQVGEIMSRFNDVTISINTLNRFFQTVFSSGIYLIIVPPFIFILQWKLAFISLVSLPITAVIISQSGRILRKYWHKSTAAYAEINAFQTEMLANIRTVKSMLLEKYIYKKTIKQIANAMNIQIKAGGISQLITLGNGTLRTLNTVLLTWIGWSLILKQEMTLGEYIAFSAYIGYLYNPLMQFINLYSDFQHSSVSLNRMYEYLDMPAENNLTSIIEDKSAENVTKINSIKLENISFGYSPEKYVLKNINLAFNPGTITAILGPSGSGKTSLLRLLIGMEEFDTGNIYYNNIISKSLTLQQIRGSISVVWQENGMFKGTIWENLTLGNENIDEETVFEAVRICRIDDLIENLPQKYETLISEWGSTLSGGQRQRFVIARAIIRNTPIIILDEATSNVDIHTETEMLRDIFTKLKEKTIIFVTHRATSTKLADNIVILEEGMLSAQGTHDELLLLNNYYNDIIIKQ